MTTRIESTGNILTIGQREHEARRHIVHKLARIEQELWILGEPIAAGHCAAAMDAMNDTRTPTKENEREPRT